MVYADKLKNLRYKREKLKAELRIIREQIVNTEANLHDRTHTIKVEFEYEVQRASAEVSKVKFSNAERRRVELEKKKNADIKLNEIKSSLETFKKHEQRLVCDEEILKIQEKYLFKEIEVFVTLKNFDAATMKAGV